MTTTTRTGFDDLASFVDANNRAGHHFFDADTMRGFRSKLPDHRMYGGRFFITSEQFQGSNGHREPRAYTVRIAKLDGTTGGAVGKFQEHATLKLARKAADLAAGGYRDALTVEFEDETALPDAYRAGRALRLFEDANAPDKYGNTRADYLREDVRSHARKIADLQAEIERLENGTAR